jgi:hypothetical protein
MKRFIRKVLKFILLPIIPLLLALFLFENYSHQSSFNDYSFNNSTESKIFKLPVTDSVNIIVAGDSRAQRQLIPKVIKSITGINSINIATSSGDLVSTVPSLSAYNDKNIFIISASSWQINDGAIDHGYLSDKCFQQLTLHEKVSIYGNDVKEIIWCYFDLIKLILKKDKYHYNDKTIKEDGFYGVDDTLKIDPNHFTDFINAHSWYKKINTNGIREKIFSKSLEKLKERNSLIIIYQPPVSSYFKENIKNTAIDKFEKEYSKKLAKLCSKSDNIVFYDFYNKDISILDNTMFYDHQHLNRNGAKVFSKIVSEKVISELKSRMNKNIPTKLHVSLNQRKRTF